MDRQIDSIEKAIATLQKRQNVRMIRLNEKRIAKLKTRFELQIQKLNQKMQGFRAYREEVVCGVLEIY
jgi:predicted  nucleic acid-binding Zn-ribbon protein